MKFNFALVAASLLLTGTMVLAQGGAQAQPQDPTTEAPSTPPTFPPSESKPEADKSSASASDTSNAKGRVFMGIIDHTQTAGADQYVLRAGDMAYQLDNPGKAKKFQGKNVKVTGRLDNTTNKLHIDKIEPSPSM